MKCYKMCAIQCYSYHVEVKKMLKKIKILHVLVASKYVLQLKIWIFITLK